MILKSKQGDILGGGNRSVRLTRVNFKCGFHGSVFVPCMFGYTCRKVQSQLLVDLVLGQENMKQ
jgi:hypothetical protein